MTLKNTYIYFLLFVLVFRIHAVLACDFTTSQPVVIIPSGTHNANAGFTQVYVLTNNQGVIVATSMNGNFGLQNFGSYNAYAFNYDNSNPPVLPMVGANISTVVGGCFSLTSPLVVTVCNTSIDSVCEDSGNPILIAMNPNFTNASGFNQYIVVVNASGNIVSVKPLNLTSGTVSYTTTAVTGELTFGNYTVYTVNYNNPSTLGSLGLTIGNAWPSNFGTACASASSGDLIQVTHCCGTITYNLDSLNLSCFNNFSGQISFANVNGGETPYSYSINNGLTFQSGTTFNGLNAGLYTVVVKDNSNCTDTNQIQINQPAVLTANIDVDSVKCFGDNSGQIFVTPSGGTTPYVYSWTSSLSTDSLETGLLAGNVTVTLTDLNGCFIDSTLTVYQPTQLSFNTTIINTTCGTNNGKITFTASGGTAPYQYSINNGITFQSLDSFPNILAGIYNLIVKDASNCTVIGQESLTNSGSPIIDSLVITAPLCFGGLGSVEIYASGGSGTLNFNMDGSAYQLSSTFTNLNANVTYTFGVKDAMGCSSTKDSIILSPTQIAVVSIDSSNISCFGLTDGFITLNVSGGTGWYQYSMNGGVLQASNNFSNLVAANYSIHVLDANSCFVDSLIIISEPLPLSIPRTITNVSCFGLNNGIINITPTGGTLPITQLWQTSGNSGLQESNLGAGSFMVTITDANNCTLDSTFTITEPLDFNVSASIVDSVSCNGLTDAIAMASVSDLTGTYSFLWNALDNNQATATAINLGGGNYTVFATNVLTGCKDTTQIVLINPSAITISVEPNPTICIGQNAIISVNGLGGTGNLVYNWDNGLSQGLSQTVSPITTTIYHVVATDNHGCGSNALAITVNVKAALSVQVLKDDTICLGSSVTISSISIGGDGNYTYSWSNGNTTSQFNAAPTTITNYILTLSDGCGSTPVTDNAVITVMSPPNANFNQTNYTGCFPVNAVYHAGTINPNYQYQWYSGSNLLSTTDSLNYNFNTIGCNDITLVVTEQINASLSCNFSHTYPNAVCVSDYPKADFTYDSTDLNIFNPFADFSNLSSNADMYSWTVDGVVFSSADNPSYNFGSDSVKSYTVCLVATNSVGCPNQYCNEVNVKDVDLFYIPNTFTPDGDHDNDIFKPVLSGFDLSTFKFQIFDRWGESIFYSEDIDTGWDGFYKNMLCQQDVYVWKISAQTIARKENKEYMGHVNLIK